VRSKFFWKLDFFEVRRRFALYMVMNLLLALFVVVSPVYSAFYYFKLSFFLNTFFAIAFSFGVISGDVATYRHIILFSLPRTRRETFWHKFLVRYLLLTVPVLVVFAVGLVVESCLGEVPPDFKFFGLHLLSFFFWNWAMLAICFSYTVNEDNVFLGGFRTVVVISVLFLLEYLSVGYSESYMIEIPDYVINYVGTVVVVALGIVSTLRAWREMRVLEARDL